MLHLVIIILKRNLKKLKLFIINKCNNFGLLKLKKRLKKLNSLNLSLILLLCYCCYNLYLQLYTLYYANIYIFFFTCLCIYYCFFIYVFSLGEYLLLCLLRLFIRLTNYSDLFFSIWFTVASCIILYLTLLVLCYIILFLEFISKVIGFFTSLTLIALYYIFSFILTNWISIVLYYIFNFILLKSIILARLYNNNMLNWAIIRKKLKIKFKILKLNLWALCNVFLLFTYFCYKILKFYFKLFLICMYSLGSLLWSLILDYWYWLFWLFLIALICIYIFN